MKTDDLIEALAAGLEPVRPARLNPLWVALAFVAAVAAVLLLLGVRSDLSQAVTAPVIWLKAGYSLAIAGAALILATELGRPGVSPRPGLYALAGIIGVAVVAAIVELALRPTSEWLAVLQGSTWSVCSRNILMVSIFAAPLIWLSARSLAPTRPMAAGAALGLLTGGLAATAYGLYCGEATAPFIATWYTLGMGLAAGIGALIGRFALRW